MNLHYSGALNYQKARFFVFVCIFIEEVLLKTLMKGAEV